MPNLPVYLAIAEPCHEDWARMTPTECGRFCQACQKEVLDFSDLAPADILAVLRAQPAGSVCGRIPLDTLAESRHQAAAAARRVHWPAVPKLRRLLAALSLPLLAPALALAAPAPATVTQPAAPTAPARPPRAVSVRVFDAAANQGLGFARVQVWRLGAPLLSVQTEVDGSARLLVPAEYWTDTLRLQVEMPGFPPTEQHFTPAEVAGVLAVSLTAGPVQLLQVRTMGYGVEQRRMVMGGAVSTVVYERPSLFKRLVVYPPWRLYLRAKRLIVH